MRFAPMCEGMGCVEVILSYISAPTCEGTSFAEAILSHISIRRVKEWVVQKQFFHIFRLDV